MVAHDLTFPFAVHIPDWNHIIIEYAREPELSRQYNQLLDSRLTISTKRQHTSTEHTVEIDLRAKHALMTNLWLLAQMKQPGRSIYKDSDKSTFIEFLGSPH